MQGYEDYVISADLAGTIDGLFRERVGQNPQDVAYTEFDRHSSEWRDLTWQQMGEQVSRWQQALTRTGLQNGDRVAICLKNGPCWVCADQAALGNGLVVVPLYTEDRPDNIAYVIQDAGARLLFIQTAKQWEKLREIDARALKGVKQVIIIERDEDDPPPTASDQTTVSFLNDWLNDPPRPLHERGGDPDDLASIVYTSGTTGKPKGVMLSHRNMLTIAEGSGVVAGVRRGQRLLSFLPLSHTFERTCGYYTPMMWCMHICYARSIQQLANDLQIIRPHVLVAVPRIFERLYERVNEQLEKQSRLKQAMFRLAVNTGWRQFEARQGRRRRGPDSLLWPLLKRRVADRLFEKLGGELQLAISGGAALPLPVARVFLGLGLNLIQGYGMTESSPVISANRLDANDPESVGMPLDGIQVRVGENDELQVRSPGVMLGYWNNHRATRDVMTPDGWLRTGDKVTIRDGMIYITGRLKDILVMSNGEKIPPVDMEDAITLDPLFDHALILGEGKAYLSALVVINSDRWFSLAKHHQLDPFDQQALANQKLHKTLLKHISAALRDFPGYAKVRRVLPSLEPWTVENGLLTPTLKTKRQIVMQQFADEIEALYTG